MIPTSFEYKRAQTVEEALAMLNHHGDGAKILAGGHSLIPALKLRLDSPDALIDIGKIPGLNSISEDGEEIVIGANCTHGMIATSAIVQSKLPMLAEAASHIGDAQVRNMGTIGGSLAHADPAADWPTLLVAAGAKIEIASSDSTRSEDAENFFQGLYTTSLSDSEIITAIRLNAQTGFRASYQKFAQPASRFALVGCAVVMQVADGVIQSARVSLGGVADHAVRASGVESALIGQAATAATAASAADLAADGLDVMSDHFAGEAYRTQMAKVFTRRAIEAALG